jgi:hypothetical protein
MPNERETLIEAILARRQDPEPRPLDQGQPGCPDITLLMNIALGQVATAEGRRVEEHAAGCSDCRARLAAYRAFLADEELAEAPYEGSLLQQIAESQFARKVPPRDSEAATGWPGRGPDCPAAREDSTVVNAEPTMAQKPSCAPAEATPSAQERNAGTVTRCAQAALQKPELWPTMAKELRPWLKAILRRVGAERADVEALLRVIQERLFATPPQENYRSLILNWVWESIETPRQESTDEILIEQAALDRALDQAGEHEPEEARRFRAEALKQALPSSQALLKFAPPAVAGASWLPTFRLQLYYEAEKLKSEWN